MHRAEKAALLGMLDQAWKEHLLALDHLRQGIHLRGYGQRDPLNEYSREAFGLFQLMLEIIREQVTKTLMQARHASARRSKKSWRADRLRCRNCTRPRPM